MGTRLIDSDLEWLISGSDEQSLSKALDADLEWLIDAVEKANPYHKPAGTSEGGEFTTGPEGGAIGAAVPDKAKTPIAEMVKQSGYLSPAKASEEEGGRGFLFPDGSAKDFDTGGDLSHPQIVEDATDGKYNLENLMNEGTGRLVVLPRQEKSEVNFDSYRTPTSAQIRTVRRMVASHNIRNLYLDREGGGYEGGPSATSQKLQLDRKIRPDEVDRLFVQTWPELSKLQKGDYEGHPFRGNQYTSVTVPTDAQIDRWSQQINEIRNEPDVDSIKDDGAFFMSEALDAYRSTKLSQRKDVSLVALEKNGKILSAGFAKNNRDGTARLEYLGSIEKGRGADALKQLESNMKAKGARTMVLTASEENEKFYKTQGYVRRDPTQTDDPEFQMFKNLTDAVEKANPYHKPGGSPEGGQFTTGPEGGAEPDSKTKDALKKFTRGEGLISARLSSTDASLITSWAQQQTPDIEPSYRGVWLSNDQWEDQFGKHDVGQSINMKALTSLTRDEIRSAAYGTGGDVFVQYKVPAGHAVDISKWSTYPQELESILPKDQSFKVANKRMHSPGFWEIELI